MEGVPKLTFLRKEVDFPAQVQYREQHQLNEYIKRELPNVAKIKNQLTYEECEALLETHKSNPKKLYESLVELDQLKVGRRKVYSLFSNVSKTINYYLKLRTA